MTTVAIRREQRRPPWMPGYLCAWDTDGCYVCEPRAGFSPLGMVYAPRGWPSEKARAVGPRFFYCWDCDTLFCLEAGRT